MTPVYTEIQVSLKSVQNTLCLYLTTHVKRVLREEILRHIIHAEMRYKEDTDGVKTKTPQKRMPWKVYREITLDMTNEISGLYEL